MKRPAENSHFPQDSKKPKLVFTIDPLFSESYYRIGSKILENLDHQSFVNCKQVCKSWHQFIGNQRSSWTREIMNFSQKSLAQDSDSKVVELLNELQTEDQSTERLRDIALLTRKLIPFVKSVNPVITMEILGLLLKFGTRQLINWTQNKPLKKRILRVLVLLQAMAANAGHLGKYKLIASLTRHPNPVYCKQGTTPLHNCRDPDIISWILTHADDPNPADNAGNTPLHDAALLGQFDRFEAIAFMNNDNVSPRNNKGETPMHLMFNFDCSEEILLRNLPFYGRITEYILEQTRDADVNPADNAGNTPLHYAALYGLDSIFQAIASRVKNPNPRNFKGQTPLHFACKKQNIRQFKRTHIVALIWRHCGFSNPKDHDGNTPLHEAAKSGNEYLFKMIASRVNNMHLLENSRRQTPLDLAVKFNHHQLYYFTCMMQTSAQNDFAFF